MFSTPSTPTERRRDPLLRDLVSQCQGRLGRRGFSLAQRGSSAEHSWVQFRCPARDPAGLDGTLMVLVAHGQREHTVMVDAYFVDSSLEIHTPRHKLLHRYAPESELPGVVREVVDTVSEWRA